MGKPTDIELQLADALRPFVLALKKASDPATADLDDEQPMHISVQLGDLRKAQRMVWKSDDRADVSRRQA